MSVRIGGMELGHTVHPEIKKYHKSYSTSSKDLRAMRDKGKQVCAVCGILEYKLRRCGKCKHAAYCSKDCQGRIGAPTHKNACNEVNSGVNMMKIAQNLDASTFLNMQLQSAFILAFDLLREPRLDRPFAVRIDIGVEPTDLMAFINIYAGGQPAEKTEGMVQINAFTPLPDAFIGEQAMRVWRNTRDGMTSAGFATSPVGLVVLSKASALIHMFPITIYPQMMDMIRDSPTFTRISSFTGITTVVPIDVGGLMDTSERTTKNKLSLRTEMSVQDFQTIRAAADGNVLATRPADWAMVAPPPQLAATILKEKIARESMYQITFAFK
ncbi:hypothetical protein B0H14DRAFT_3506162 [Mycena olivaceomarginata]|nr:hypothetical protein B0H14DRAFT_3506162 [Mycena olivaceomarginata]